MSRIPRPEYPRPLLVREKWLNLNGTWRFRADPKDEGLTSRWFGSLWDEFSKIVVPFPVESEASGVNETEPSSVVWYQKEFQLPSDWKDRIVLRIGACDHWTRVFVNGLEVGQHRGGYAPFSFVFNYTIN